MLVCRNSQAKMMLKLCIVRHFQAKEHKVSTIKKKKEKQK